MVNLFQILLLWVAVKVLLKMTKCMEMKVTSAREAVVVSVNIIWILRLCSKYRL